MLKTLHVIYGMMPGGAETYLPNLVGKMGELAGVRNEVIVQTVPGPMSENLENLGIPVYYAGMRKGYDPPGIARMAKMIRRANPDIIHGHSNNPALNFMLRFYTTPKVYTEHAGDLLGGSWKSTAIYGPLDPGYRFFVAISGMAAERMEGVNPRIRQRIRIVHNGINIEKIDAAPVAGDTDLPAAFLAAPRRVGTIGSLTPQKGPETFLKTASLLARQDDGVAFAMVGDGPLRETAQRLARRLGIADRVHFLGYRTDAMSVLKTFDVFLFTSNWEPFGLVLTEAMAARVPVVSLNVNSAASEIITDGREGMLVDEKSPELLAERTIQLLRDGALRESIILNARRRVEVHFTIERNAKSIFDLYRECLCSDQTSSSSDVMQPEIRV